MTSMPDTSANGIDLSEAARQLELAVHDSQVAYDCVGLGNLDRAHEHAITARIAADAAEHLLRAALATGMTSEAAEAAGEAILE
jgi:hypothetical protein